MGEKIFFTLIIIGAIFIISFIIALYHFLSDKINHNKLSMVKIDAEEDLKKELKKPLSHVLIKTKSGLIFKTKDFKPYYKILDDLIIHNFFIEKVYLYEMVSSKDQAKKAIDKWISSEKFEDAETDTFIPICEIESFKVLYS